MRLLRPTASKRVVFFLFFDLLLSLGSFYLSYLLRFNFSIPVEFLYTFFNALVPLLVLKVVLLYSFRNYHLVWRFAAMDDALNLIKALASTYFLFGLSVIAMYSVYAPFPRSVVIIDLFISLFFLGALRFSKRFWLELLHENAEDEIIVFGVGVNTSSLIKSVKSGELAYRITAIIDCNKSEGNAKRYFNNIPVFPLERAERIIDESKAKHAVITQQFDRSILQELTNRLSQTSLENVLIYDPKPQKNKKVHELSLEDLLARKPKDLDKEAIKHFIAGKTIAITGAGGSIGSELCLQCERFGAKKLLCIDNSEFNLYQVNETLSIERSMHMISITNTQTLHELFKEHKPDMVLHAAAYKHVPLCEANIKSAIENNVFGSKNVIDASIASQVKKVVVISTDKAVRPTNVMGTTKRIAELYAQNVPSEHTEIVMVRFGNVLGSSGSVIPKFMAQIDAGGPVTVTHPKITRFFMLIEEACQLVLQAASIAEGRELFVLDMGEPVKISELAETMISLYAKEAITIEYTGLRPGEKLYEELLINPEDTKTKYDSIFVAPKSNYNFSTLSSELERLRRSEDPLTMLKEIVPEFLHQTN